MAQTKKPTGLSITRNGNSYTFAWKIGDDNYGAGQKLQYRTQSSGEMALLISEWTNVSVTSSATSKAVTINKSNFYPTVTTGACKLEKIEFRVKGKKSPYTKDGKTITPDYSDYTTKTMTISTPSKPVLTSAIGSSWNISTFAWSIDANDKDEKIYTSYEWQTIMVEDSTVTNGSKLEWKSSNAYWQTGTGTATSGTKSITESTSVVSTGSHTRWLRVRSRGPAGDSAWAYAKLVYAKPFTPKIGDCKVTEKSSNYLVSVEWSTASNSAHPIDQIKIEYSMGVPTADMQMPSSPSWTTATTSSDSKGTDKVTFYTSGKLASDQCMWVKVTASHDNRGTESAVKLVLVGSLADPTMTSATVSNGVASVNATNNSSACIYTGNDSSVKRLFMLVYYKDNKKYKDAIAVGVIATSDSVPKSINVPNYSGVTAYKIGVRAMVGTYTYSTVTADNTRRYSVDADMQSVTKWTSGNLPVEPSNLTAKFEHGKVIVGWDWSWADADEVELSWATSQNAWSSTEQPESYLISQQATNWIISGLEVGGYYVIRARFHDSTNDLWSDYSDPAFVTLTSAPRQPKLTASSGVVARHGTVTLSWTYESTDGSEQAYAFVYYNNTVVAHTTTAKQVTLGNDSFIFESGNYDFEVEVCSESGSFSEKSNKVRVAVQTPPTATISQTSLTTVSGVYTLTEMPMTITVTGAGTGGMTSVAIERAEDYFLERPDEAQIGGYRGETVLLVSYIGEAQQTVENGNLMAYLDDGAKYRLVATVKDGLGQTDTAIMDFVVDWSHQAIVPQGTVVMDGTIAKITPTAPTGTATGDYCDIYRLSKDKPELVYSKASFGSTYVDPYPAINGGHRIVFRTKNGDYITASNTFAWLDLEDQFTYDKTIIDFGTDKVELCYNVDANHSWTKDFIETKYLGGSVQGDWNPAVTRTASVNAVTLNLSDEETIEALRRLAVYSGICNVRTADGSSFHANIDVSESNPHDKYGLVSEFSLNITRVDGQDYDGVILSAWS